MKETLVFTGRAREYFRVWIVNLFLTIVTLGLYSAWAKVRKKRYLHGHTWLAGSNFDYHGDPWAILRGRLVALAAFLAYTVATHFSPRVGALVLLALLPAVPWLILRSFAFNAANTSWRHLRFGFDGRYLDALKVVAPFILVPLGTLLLPLPDAPRAGARNLGVALAPGGLFMRVYPYARARVALLQINGSRYAGTPFACAARVRSFYAIYVKASLVMLLLALTIGVVIGLSGGLVAAAAENAEFVTGAIILAYVAVGGTALGYTRTRTTNLLLNATRLGGLALRSNVSARRLMSLYIVNVAAIVATFGLAVPWAVVRTARYRASCLAVEGDVPLESFAARRRAESVSATGEEMGEMFALDLSL